jgi:anti-sigma regulatory factor (Ser/Thr protein kinase)
MTSNSKRIAARIDNLIAANEFVEECSDRYCLDDKKKFALLLTLEEAFVNICSYAYPDGEGEAEIFCEVVDDAFVLEIVDSGKPFDVLSLPDPDTTLDLADRQIGGMGIHFIRKMSDCVSYRWEGGRNILRMVFRLRP